MPWLFFFNMPLSLWAQGHITWQHWGQWSGDLNAYQLDSSGAHLDAPGTGTYLLRHPLSLTLPSYRQPGASATYSGAVTLDFNPSTSNCAWVQWQGQGALYELRLGCTNDCAELWRDDGARRERLAQSPDGWLSSGGLITWHLTWQSYDWHLALTTPIDTLLWYPFDEHPLPCIHTLELGCKVTSTRVQGVHWSPITWSGDSASPTSPWHWQWTEAMLDPDPPMSALSISCDALEGVLQSPSTDPLIWVAGASLRLNDDLEPLPARWLPPHHPIVIASSHCFATLGIPLAQSWPLSLSLPATLQADLLLHDSLSLAPITWRQTQHHPSDKSDGGWSLVTKDTSCACCPTCWQSYDAMPGHGMGTYAHRSISQRTGGIRQIRIGDSLQITWRHPITSLTPAPPGWTFHPDVHTSIAIPANASPAIPSGTPQRLDLPILYHCDGTPVDTSYILWGIPASPDSSDIILTEFLQDPLPGEPRFAELHNTSSRVLDLSGLHFSDAWPPRAFRRAAPAGTFLLPGATTFLSMDPQRTLQRYPAGDSAAGMSPPAELPSDLTLVLLDASGTRLDQVTYDKGLHHPAVQPGEGISITRRGHHWVSSGADSATPGRHLMQPPSIEGTWQMLERNLNLMTAQRPLLSYNLRPGNYTVSEMLVGIEMHWQTPWTEPRPTAPKDILTCTATAGQHLPPGPALWVIMWTRDDGVMVRRSYTIVIANS